MRYIRVSCPGCDTPTAYAIDDGEIAVECPACGQKNVTTNATAPLTGLCGECKQPIDDHIFVGQFYGDCPKKRKDWT